ncbi:MAG TPA: von Willebrand factor type A domain-containing protein [Vicinamibacterales bacterium]|nr:von Willebrand factor type A domain-containing protein [Vicinamibacterales bacterium]
MSIRGGKLLWFVVCLLASVQWGLARQQSETSAVIAGTVIDSSGGVIPGATVALEHDAKTLATKVTDSKGQFTFDNVAAGAYRLRASLQGFKTLTRDLQVAGGAKHTGLKLVLEVGSMSEEVTVMAATSAISSQTTTFTTRSGTASARQTRGRDLTAATTDERYGQITPNQFQLTSEHPLSTFAADVDTASYTNVRRFLSKGQLPPIDAVRVEELINYFRFPYAEPTDGRPVSITTEVSDCPWARGHKLALIGLRAKAIDDREAPGRNITLLLDVSGSMAPPERLPLIKTALRMFVDTLRDEDRIAIVVYASASGLVLPATPGSQRQRIHDAIESLDAGGSTNGADGIRLAYQVATRNFIRGGTNRVILATDGDFNVGTTSHADLVALIERERQSGVFLSVLGVGSGNLKDATMEMLADKGNGHYAYLDSLQEARRVLVREGGATLETVAKDVKFQIEFNPQQVAAYRLIGYENRLLADRDFNDDTKDAGELGAGHSVTVLYEIVPAGSRLPKEMASGSGSRPEIDPLRYQVTRQSVPPAVADELMMVKVRYKAPHGSRSELMTRQVRESEPARYLSFASAVAEFGLLLREDRPMADRWRALSTRLKGAAGAGTPAERELLAELVETAAALKKTAAEREQQEW